MKVTVDAYDGTVRFYVADAQDPIVRAYARAFPGLLEPLAAMPADLRAHIRYPAGLLRHPGADVRHVPHAGPAGLLQQGGPLDGAAHGRGGRDREMEPYYTIMRIPGEQREEFVLLMPFTPLRRDNMIAWLAARSDGPVT